jgi:hypothetical protein
MGLSQSRNTNRGRVGASSEQEHTSSRIALRAGTHIEIEQERPQNRNTPTAGSLSEQEHIQDRRTPKIRSQI